MSYEYICIATGRIWGRGNTVAKSVLQASLENGFKVQHYYVCKFPIAAEAVVTDWGTLDWNSEFDYKIVEYKLPGEKPISGKDLTLPYR